MIDNQTFKIGSTQERGGRKEVKAIRHQTAVDVLELVHTIIGIGMTQAWLEKCVAMDANGSAGRTRLDGHYMVIALFHFSEMC